MSEFYMDAIDSPQQQRPKQHPIIRIKTSKLDPIPNSDGTSVRLMSARRQASNTSLSKYAREPSPEAENRSLDFCNAFWGTGDAGVDVLFARMRGAIRTMEELRNFWKERYVRSVRFRQNPGRPFCAKGNDRGAICKTLDCLDQDCAWEG